MKIQNGISLTPAPPDKTDPRDAGFKDAAQMYENYFLNEIMKSMRSTTGQDDDGVVKKNFAEKIFTEKLDEQYADSWAQKGGIGLADMIYKQLRDQFEGATQKQILGLKHMIPLAPQKDPTGVTAPDSIQLKTLPSRSGAKLSYRFEVPSPSGAAFDVQAPLAGKVVGVDRLENGWSSLRLDHGQGLRSELTFPGQVTESVAGRTVEPGQRLGVLDPSRPVLAWNLDWS